MRVGKVWNRSSRRCPDDAMNIMRGTPYGNPFIIGVHGDREEVCRRFRVEVLPKLDLTPLIGKDVMCCCKPKMCHGDDLVVWAWFRNLQAMAKKAKEIGPQVFMDQRALAFLRAWPRVEPGLRPAYSRFQSAGLIWIDPNVDAETDLDGAPIWPGAMRLTRAGEVLKVMVDSQGYNMFSQTQVVAIRDALQDESAFKADVIARQRGFEALWKDQLPKFAVNCREWPTGMPGGPGLGLNSAIRELKLALAENRKARRGK